MDSKAVWVSAGVSGKKGGNKMELECGSTNMHIVRGYVVTVTWLRLFVEEVNPNSSPTPPASPYLSKVGAFGGIGVPKIVFCAVPRSRNPFLYIYV